MNGSGQKSMRSLHAIFLAELDLIQADRSLRFPRSQNRDLGHPISVGRIEDAGEPFQSIVVVDFAENRGGQVEALHVLAFVR